MSPVRLPEVPPLPIERVPAEMVVLPAWVLLPMSVRLPEPSLVTFPEPLMLPE